MIYGTGRAPPSRKNWGTMSCGRAPGRAAWALAGALVGVLGCEYTSLTDAREQLGRGRDRIATYTIPVRNDTITVSDVLADFLGMTTTVIGNGVLAVAADPETLTVDIPAGVGVISGVLDSSVLKFSAEAYREFSAAGLNLGEFEDAIRDASLNAALAVLVVTNTADAPLTLTNFNLGVVRIDPVTGQPRRKGDGTPDYEVDGNGDPILVALADPGVTTYAIGRNSTRVDTLSAGPLVDRLVDLVLDGVRTALLGAGDVSAGDGTVGTISAGDELRLELTPVVGFDLTLPASGVSFDSNTVQDGLGLDTSLADDVTERIVEAQVTLAASNGTPFGLEVVAAVVRGNVTGDVFAAPGRVLIDTLRVAPGSVDPATGLVTQPVLDATAATLTGTEAREFLDEEFTAGLRIRLLPPAGNRAAVRGTDRVIVAASARLRVRLGGSP